MNSDGSESSFSKIFMLIRLIIDVVFFGSVIHGWWFVALLSGMIGTLRYRWFPEILIAGIAYDSLFGLLPGQEIHNYAGIITALVLFIVSRVLRSILRE